MHPIAFVETAAARLAIARAGFPDLILTAFSHEKDESAIHLQ